MQKPLKPKNPDKAENPYDLLPEEEGLSVRERMFVDALLGEAKGDVGSASKLAGVTPPTGKRWLERSPVQRAVRRRLKLASRVASPEDVLDFWTNAMAGNEGGALRDRLRASELLASFYGLTTTRKDVKVEVKHSREDVFGALEEMAKHLQAPETKQLEATVNAILVEDEE